VQGFTLGHLIETSILVIGAVVILLLLYFKPSFIDPRINKWAASVIVTTIVLVSGLSMISWATLRDIGKFDVTISSGDVRAGPPVSKDEDLRAELKRELCSAQNKLNSSITCFFE
jgi:hypothetical protein